ncbi:HNH endonuclease [Anabaena sp. WFMT]|uniref:HNH endonuclease n=1 Tax=Anabaena sp. WFMT TaxID=3449730 RepID=UPI003F27474F
MQESGVRIKNISFFLRPGEKPTDTIKPSAYNLQVHHWNRDPSDNRPKNLVCLCSFYVVDVVVVVYTDRKLAYRTGGHKKGRHFSSTYHSPHDRIRLLGFFIISAYNSNFVLLVDANNLAFSPSLCKIGMLPVSFTFTKTGKLGNQIGRLAKRQY